MRNLYVLSSVVWGFVELIALQRSRYHTWRARCTPALQDQAIS